MPRRAVRVIRLKTVGARKKSVRAARAQVTPTRTTAATGQVNPAVGKVRRREIMPARRPVINVRRNHVLPVSHPFRDAARQEIKVGPLRPPVVMQAIRRIIPVARKRARTARAQVMQQSQTADRRDRVVGKVRRREIMPARRRVINAKSSHARTATARKTAATAAQRGVAAISGSSRRPITGRTPATARRARP